MSETRSDFVVSMPSNLFTLAREFKSCTNGSIYIGKVNTDPQLPDNQLPIYIENEDGSHIPIAQPIKINGAGYPVYQGRVAKIVVSEKHSMMVLNSYGVQQFYFQNAGIYNPVQINIDISNLSDQIKSLVKTVNAKSPDDDGNVQLSAVDVGSLPSTGGTVTGEIKSTTEDNYRITAGDRSFFLRYDGKDFYVLKTAAGDPDGKWDDTYPLRIGNDGAVYIEGERPKETYVTGVRLSGLGTADNGNNDNLYADAPDGTIVVSALQKGNYMAVKYRYLQYCINGDWKTVSIS